MNKTALITLILGALGGYLIGAHGPALEQPKETGGHAHETRDVTGVVPSVDLVLHDDPAGGYIAQVLVTNFVFAPENVSTEAIDGEGHAHMYVNGEKINRVLGEWYNIGKLGEGEHEISVRLSSNDHFELTTDGELIMDSETVTVVEKEEGSEHNHQ